MKLLFIIILIIIAILFNIPLEYKRRRLLQRFWSRSCMGRQWKRRFPDASKDSIREFLELFVDAFAFSSAKQLKFSPDDKIMDVYRSLYPFPGCADAMELGIFAMNIEDKYGFDITREYDRNMTLGQLFDIIRNHKGNSN